MQRILIIGLGGIGGSLTEPLARYLAYSNATEELALVDGDRYESKNKDRQNITAIDSGRHKADVWAGRLAPMFPAMKVVGIACYVTPANVRDIIPDGSVVLLCVDNHATRSLVQEHCLKLRDVVLINGGNDYTDGNVQAFRKKAGRVLCAPITKFHPEIEFPEDRRPDEIGCDEEVVSAPQLIMANFMAAALMLNAVYGAMNSKELAFSEAYFDVVKNSVRTLKRAA